MNVPAHNEQPDRNLAAIIAQLQAQLAEKDQQLSRRDQALALAEVKIQVLEERLRLNRIARYGNRVLARTDTMLRQEQGRVWMDVGSGLAGALSDILPDPKDSIGC